MLKGFQIYKSRQNKPSDFHIYFFYYLSEQQLQMSQNLVRWEDDYHEHKVQYIESLSKSISTSEEQFDLYQKIIKFLNDDCKKDVLVQYCPPLLKGIDRERLFEALFSYFAQKSSTKGYSNLETVLVQFFQDTIEHKQNKENSYQQVIQMKRTGMVKIIMTGKSNLMEKVIVLCKRKQSTCRKVIQLISDCCLNKALKEPVKGFNFTPTIELALQLIITYANISSSLLDQAYRYVLIVDIIQNGQLSQIILDNRDIVDKIFEYGNTQSVSGYWYDLVSRMGTLDCCSQNECYGKMQHIMDFAYTKIISVIQADSDLSTQISKIIQMEKPNSDKMRYIQMLRGYSIFMERYHERAITKKNNQAYYKIIEQLLGIRDFISFSHVIKAYSQLYDRKLVILNPKAIKNIQENCLPISATDVPAHLTQNINELHFLQNRFEDPVQFKTSPSSSSAMTNMLGAILDTRNCRFKPKICDCFEQYMHQAIQSQYDNEFNPHQFMAACNLMRQQIERVIKLDPHQEDVEKLKSYLLTNLKWLLNLNESCLPQYRRCIHLKIFDLLIAFPPLLVKNEFLQETIDDHLVLRLSNLLPYVKWVINFYRNLSKDSENTMSDEMHEGKAKLDRLGNKIMKNGHLDSLKFDEKLQIWDILFNLFDKNQEKMSQLFTLHSLQQETNLAKYTVAKKRKYDFLNKLESNGCQIEQRISKNPHFYKDIQASITSYLQNP